MVKVIGLAIAVAACWTCAPAQADVLRLESSSVSLPATANVAGSASPAAAQVAASVTSVSASAAAQPTIRTAAAAAEPAVEAAVTATTLQVAQRRAGDSGGLRTGASSHRRSPSARLRRSAPAPRGAAPVSDTRPARPEPPAAMVVRDKPAGAAATHATSARPAHSVPPHPQPAPPADGGVSAGAAGPFAGGLAMLAGALVLLAPRLRRRLVLDPAVSRPAAFVALLERPG